MPAHDIKDLAAMLAQRIDALVPELLPHARRDRTDWCVGSIEGEPGRRHWSLRICHRPGKAGWWKDFSTEESGDALDLVAQVRFGGDRKRAYHWALAWLGLSNSDPAAFRREAAKARRRRDDALAEQARRLEKDRKRAFAIWLGGEGKPQGRQDLRGTPVDLYLQGRGIDLRALGRQPGALRYNPACWCAEAEAKLPAMVAVVQEPVGKFLAVHRTWLARRPDGTWHKAELTDQRKCWPSFRGGLIPLWRGENGCSLKQAMQDGLAETLCITEGIEDALTNALAHPDWRHVAAVSLGNLGNLVLPKTITDIVVCADNDWGNDGAAQTLDAACARLGRAGHKVRIARSPVGKDMNDLLRDGAAA